MDNQPRQKPGVSVEFHHGHQVWADACMQQLLSCRMLIQMAKLIGREKDVECLQEEEEFLSKVVNQKLWDPESCFYYDLWSDGRLNHVKTIGAYWALLAGCVPPEGMDGFIAHLRNPGEFNRPHRVPSLSADHQEYREDGGYWLGGVWAPTNYMVLKGLEKAGEYDLAREIAINHVENVTKVCLETGTLWENYVPEQAAPGNPAKKDFVGWTGLSPIAIVIEEIFGIHGSARERRITWRVREESRHGVLRYPMGADAVDLISPAHKPGEKPKVEINATGPVTVELQWPDGTTDIIEAGK